MNFDKLIKSKAKARIKNIVLPEAEISSRILNAGLFCAKNKLAKITLIANDDRFDCFKSEFIEIINIKTFNRLDEMAEKLFEIRKHKGLTILEATQLLKQNLIYFGTMLVKMGIADGMVAGAEFATKDVLLPAFQIIKGINNSKVSSVFILNAKKNKFIKKDKLIFVSDASIIIEPTEKDLAEITINGVCVARLFIENPKVALLSYSTFNSGKGKSVDLINDTMKILEEQKVDFIFEGPIQADSALREDVAKIKMGTSALGGDADVLIFPDMTSANIGVKLFQIANGCEAIGPISQGLNNPINDISRGASINEIVLSICLSSVQCKN